MFLGSIAGKKTWEGQKCAGKSVLMLIDQQFIGGELVVSGLNRHTVSRSVNIHTMNKYQLIFKETHAI